MCRTAADAHDQRWIYDGTEGNISKDAVLERVLGRDRHTLLLAGSSKLAMTRLHQLQRRHVGSQNPLKRPDRWSSRGQLEDPPDVLVYLLAEAVAAHPEGHVDRLDSPSRSPVALNGWV